MIHKSLIDTIHRAVEKIRKRGDVPADNIKYFMVKDPKFSWFYHLLKMKCSKLENVTGRLVIWNCGFCKKSFQLF